MMDPAMFGWWKHAREAARHAHEEAHAHAHGGHHAYGGRGRCGPGAEAFASSHDDGDFGGGHFGVRRPLRFLAHKLDLDEKQVASLAQILDDLKTERAQAAVDHRRTTSAFADAIAAETFDATKAGAAAAERVKSAEKLRDAVAAALGKIHALLNQDQRQRLAYLLRTGALSM